MLLRCVGALLGWAGARVKDAICHSLCQLGWGVGSVKPTTVQAQHTDQISMGMITHINITLVFDVSSNDFFWP